MTEVIWYSCSRRVAVELDRLLCRTERLEPNADLRTRQAVIRISNCSVGGPAQKDVRTVCNLYSLTKGQAAIRQIF